MPLEPFDELRSTAHVIENANVDTDIIFPARFLLLIEREGMGRYAFNDWRKHSDGSDNVEFPIPGLIDSDRKILVAGSNFGCGSSREQAVWSLVDLGLRCIIAPSFGEIFYNNCFKSGVLPVRLPDADAWSRVRDAARNDSKLHVDLKRQLITLGTDTGEPIGFDVSAHNREALLMGIDDIDRVLEQDGDDIRAFEKEHRARVPWLFSPLR